MDTETFRGKWNQLKGEAKKQWGKLTDDQLQQINGERDKLIGTIQEDYAISRQEAQKQVENWENRINR